MHTTEQYAYEVRHGNWQHVVALFLLLFILVIRQALRFMYDAIIYTDEGRIFLIYAHVTVFCIVICVVYIEIWRYNERLFVVVPREEYVYHSTFGDVTEFSIHDILRVEEGGFYIGGYGGLANSLLIVGLDGKKICRIDFSMKNAIKLTNELKSLLPSDKFIAGMTDEERKLMEKGFKERLMYSFLIKRV